MGATRRDLDILNSALRPGALKAPSLTVLLNHRCQRAYSRHHFFLPFHQGSEADDELGGEQDPLIFLVIL